MLGRPSSQRAICAPQPRRARQFVQRRDTVHAHHQPHREVVAEVGTDSRQRCHHRQAQVLQQRRRPHARQLQQPGCVQRTGADQHLAPRGHLMRAGGPLPRPVAHAAGAGAVEPHGHRARPGAHCQVGAPAGRPQVGTRRTHAPAAVDAALEVADPRLRGAVVVGVQRQAKALCTGDEGAADRVRPRDVAHRQRAAAAAPAVVTADAAFIALEVGQHVGIGPAGVATRSPAVEVLPLAAVVDQAVDRGRAAQRAALWQRDAAVVRQRVGLGRERPRQPRVEGGLDEPGRQVDPGVPVARAGLQQAHAVASVLAQPVGQDCAGSPAADDHVVEAAGVDGGRHTPRSLTASSRFFRSWSNRSGFMQAPSGGADRTGSAVA